MIIIFTLTGLAMFIIHVESYRVRLALRALIKSVNSTFGKSIWVYPNLKQPQPYMRNNTIQSYK